MLKEKFQEQQLVQILQRLTCVYLWMNLKQNFYNPSHRNLWHGLDTLMTIFLFEIMAKTNLENS